MIRWFETSLTKTLIAALSALWPATVACACCCGQSGAVEDSCCASDKELPCTSCASGVQACGGDVCGCLLQPGERRERTDSVLPGKRPPAGGTPPANPFESQLAALLAGDQAVLGHLVVARPARILYGVWRN